MKISGWIFDVYPVNGGMRLWMIDGEGSKHRLGDPFSPSFYIGGSVSLVRTLGSQLLGLNLPLELSKAEGVEFYSGKAIPVMRVRVADPAHFAKAVRWCTAAAIKPEGHGISLYNCDLSLPQLYFFERESFPLAFCEVEADAAGTIRKTSVLDSVWRTDYTLPPLSVMTLRMEGEGIRPDHPGPRRLEAVINGRTTSLEAEDEAGLVDRFDRLLLRYDPDLILSEWGDSYILPKLTAMAKKKQFPLLLNREPGSGTVTRRGRSAFTYGQAIHRAQSHLLLGRWHIDLHNSFLIGQTELEGLFEFSRLSKIPVQQMARTPIDRGMTSMQIDLAFRDGILIPWRKQAPKALKRADPLRSDEEARADPPKSGFHEEVAEIDFASIYPALMARYNLSPETVDCNCCSGPAVPEIGRRLCTKRRGLIPRFLEPFLAKRAEYDRLKKAASDPELKKRYDDRRSALKWGLATTFGSEGYQDTRFGKIEAHEAITARAREKRLKAMELVESEGFEMIHAAADSLWLRKPGLTEREYEALAERISKRCEVPIAFEGIYRWVLFPPSKSDREIAIPDRHWGVFRSGEVKLGGIETRRGDTAPFIRTAQIKMIEILSQARNREEYMALLPKAEEILAEYQERLKRRHVSFWELALSKTISPSSEAFRKESLTAIVAKELAGRGVRLSPGENISYIITDSRARVKSDRARALGFIEGSWHYDVSEYESLLLEAAETLIYDESRLF